ncbi:MAG: hypothetical protein IJP20_05820 [Clostridia bacterium]|nr:hypothetical protein [Clostridia bacterium]
MKHEIINNGKPNIKNISKPEFNIFCKSILDIIIENKKDASTIKNKTTTDNLKERVRRQSI